MKHKLKEIKNWGEMGNKIKVIFLLIALFSIALFIGVKKIHETPKYSCGIKKLEDLSDVERVKLLAIHDISTIIAKYEKSIDNKDEINKILDQKFQAKKCLELEELYVKVISADLYSEESSNVCDIPSFTHYIEAKILLGKKDELLKNEKIISIINNTYNNNKAFYANKTYPFTGSCFTFGGWIDTLYAMKLLDLLNQKEKDFWVIKYANSKIDENDILSNKFLQEYRGAWLIGEVANIYNVNTLIKEYNLNISEIEDNICSYVPSIKSHDYLLDNSLNEPRIMLFNRYLRLKYFCNFPLTNEDKKEYDIVFKDSDAWSHTFLKQQLEPFKNPYEVN